VKQSIKAMLEIYPLRNLYVIKSMSEYGYAPESFMVHGLSLHYYL